MKKVITLIAFLLTGALTTSCGSSESSPSPALVHPSSSEGFDYAAFLARNPIPEDMDYDEINVLDSDDYDPSARNVDDVLEKWDDLLDQSGVPVSPRQSVFQTRASKCTQGDCSVWAFVSKSTQRLSLYIDGVLKDTWLVSSGTGTKTPDFETHPDGRIYDKYSSKKYPGGDYNGLGNMPYAVFISGGFAIHGTPKANWPKLGTKASHGCIRVHPDNGFRFNRLVREVGVKNTWISID